MPTEVTRVPGSRWRDLASVLTKAFCNDESYLAFTPGVAGGDWGAAAAEMALSCKTHRSYGFPFLGAIRDGECGGAMLLQDPLIAATPPWILRFWWKQRWRRIVKRLGMEDRFLQVKCGEEIESHAPPNYYHFVSHIGVMPECQGEGIGRALLDAAYELAVQKPASRGLHLATYNPRFADSLEKRGWKVDRTREYGAIHGASCFRANPDFDPKLYSANGELISPRMF